MCYMVINVVKKGMSEGGEGWRVGGVFRYSGCWGFFCSGILEQMFEAGQEVMQVFKRSNECENVSVKVRVYWVCLRNISWRVVWLEGVRFRGVGNEVRDRGELEYRGDVFIYYIYKKYFLVLVFIRQFWVDFLVEGRFIFSCFRERFVFCLQIYIISFVVFNQRNIQIFGNGKQKTFMINRYSRGWIIFFIIVFIEQSGLNSEMIDQFIENLSQFFYMK